MSISKMIQSCLLLIKLENETKNIYSRQMTLGNGSMKNTQKQKMIKIELS